MDLWGLCESDVRTDSPHSIPSSGYYRSTDNEYAQWKQEQEELNSEKHALEIMKNKWDEAVEANKNFYRDDSACDEYLEKVNNSFGKEPQDWLPTGNTYTGPSKGNPNYIDHYKEKGLLQTDMGKGLYDVFMDTDAPGNAKYYGQPHSLSAFQDFDGTIYTSEFSVNEEGKRAVINGIYKDQESFESDYGYNMFYYLKVADPSDYIQ